MCGQFNNKATCSLRFLECCCQFLKLALLSALWEWDKFTTLSTNKNLKYHYKKRRYFYHFFGTKAVDTLYLPTFSGSKAGLSKRFLVAGG